MLDVIVERQYPGAQSKVVHITIAAAANILSRFILLSFSSLILNGDKMKTPLVPLLHVLLKLTVVRNNNRNYQS
jgi:hypothetical protein